MRGWYTTSIVKVKCTIGILKISFELKDGWIKSYNSKYLLGLGGKVLPLSISVILKRHE